MTPSPAPALPQAAGHPKDMAHRYQVFGKVLASAVPLPDLPPAATADGPADFRLRLGPVPEALEAPLHVDAARQVDAGQFLLGVPGLGRMLVRRGADVTLDPEPGRSDALYTFLRGSCLAHLSLMAGQVPLHASGLATPGGAVLFAGHSGAGKSSLAAALVDAGLGLVADDICHLRPAGDGVEVWPLLREVRLWRDSARALGWDGRPATKLFDALDKYRFDGPLSGDDPLPVRAIYRLDGGPEETGVAIERLEGLPALRVLLDNTYGARVMVPMGRETGQVRLCVGLATRVPDYQLRYPKRFNALPALVDALRRHWGRDG